VLSSIDVMQAGNAIVEFGSAVEHSRLTSPLAAQTHTTLRYHG